MSIANPPYGGLPTGDLDQACTLETVQFARMDRPATREISLPPAPSKQATQNPLLRHPIVTVRLSEYTAVLQCEQ